MKKIFILLVTFCLTGIGKVSAQIRSNRDLIGKWEGKDMTLEFSRDSKVIMIIPGGKLPVATYTADFMKNPIELKITLTDNGQKIVYSGRLAFTDNETITLHYSGESNPDIAEKGRTVTLKKSR